MIDNFERMVKLAEEFFETKNDPAQISVNEDVMAKLRGIHPGTLSEELDGNGPVAWVLLIPTSDEVMEDFLSHRITEQELLDQTFPGTKFDAVYLCSALVLPEYRGKGLAKWLAVNAIQLIQQDNPVRTLYYWSFSIEGDALAASVANECGLPLLRRGVV